WVYEQLLKFYKNNIHLISHCNKYNHTILFNSAYLYLISCYYIDIEVKILLVFYLITNAKYPLVTIYFVFCGYVSNYNLINLLLLSTLFYLFINLYYFKNAPLPKIPLTLIPNYTQNINIVKNLNISTINEDYKKYEINEDYKKYEINEDYKKYDIK